MNANSQLQTPAIKVWLEKATSQLSNVGIYSARLDAQIILAYALNKKRTYLHAHNDKIIDKKSIVIADNYLSQRLKRVPIAYIIGHKEFYGREFIVNSDTLIPRPESEDIITALKQLLSTSAYHLPSTTYHLLDLGTGSGCLGITAKLEFPNLDVTLIDISKMALKTARINAKKYLANVNIIQSDLLQNYTEKVDIIIANLPYVDKSWDRSAETDYEPKLALFAESGGKSIIIKLIQQIQKSLKSGGYLILEADPTQHNSIIKYASKCYLTKTYQSGYIITFKLDLLNH